jgi:RpiB/LacA/LacB family sugar-phosphate isomerase
MKTILFVCTGNVCRSPMAEGLFRNAVKGRGGFRVMSAGVGAVDGQAPSGAAIRVMQEIGIDISGQRSRMLTAQWVEQADYIFGMTRGHVESIALLYPQATEKTFLLREFDDTLDAFEKDVPDPIGGSVEVYRDCRDQIEQGLASMLKFIDQTSGAAAAGSGAGRLSIALGSDHAGFELKQRLKRHFDGRGWEVTDLGTHSAESVDYPDFALPVARGVASRAFDLGILCCGTGIGMSIAANKVPGVRAAAVCDEQTAALARQHNQANVLCLGGRIVTPEKAFKIGVVGAAVGRGGSGHRAGGRSRGEAPAGEHRADRQREFHQPCGHGGAGFSAHEQVRGRIPSKALVRRVRVRG